MRFTDSHYTRCMIYATCWLSQYDIITGEITWQHQTTVDFPCYIYIYIIVAAQFAGVSVKYETMFKFPLFEKMCLFCFTLHSLQWRHNGHDCVSNHQPHDCLLNGLFRCRSKKTWKLCVTDLCAENSQGTGEFSAQMASNAEDVSISWRHHMNSVHDGSIDNASALGSGEAAGH